MIISNKVYNFPFSQETMTYEQDAERRAILSYKLFFQIKPSESQAGRLDIPLPLKMSGISVFHSTACTENSVL